MAPKINEPESKIKQSEFNTPFVFFRSLIAARIWVLAGLTVGAVFGGLISYARPLNFEARVVLSPVLRTVDLTASSLLSQFSSGLGLPLARSSEQVPLAILRSDNFAASFISKYNLTPQLIGDRFASSTADERLRYAVEIFSQDVLQVEENARAGLVTISVTWYEPINAARWANEIARYLNSVLRERAVLESETNIKYLTSQLSEIESSIVTQSVGRIIEQEMQKAMIAASAEDYAFQIIDRANVPIKPKNLEARWLILALSIIGASIGYWSCLLVSRKPRISGKSEGEISSLMSSKD